MILHDAHNHLQHPDLAPYLGEVRERRGAGTMQVNGTGEHDWEAVERLAAAHPWIRPSYGVHPWLVDRATPLWRERLREKLEGGGAVGEIGLDRVRAGTDFDRQLEFFREQLGEAARRNVPATIHCVRAWGALENALAEHDLPERGFLLHAYGGPAEMVDAFAQRGARFSFSGVFLADGRERQREVFRRIALDRLLVETDAPSMPLPRALERRGLPLSAMGERVNHPDNLIAAYEGLARLRGLPLAELAGIVSANYERLFGA